MMDKYDLTYVTIDSLSEGVASSQVVPLISRLSGFGLKINLISYEKSRPVTQLQDYFESIGVEWNFRPFGKTGVIGGVVRFNDLRRQIQLTDVIHARSDIPTVSAIASHKAGVLWDVRSLWADQKLIIQRHKMHKAFYGTYRELEKIAAHKSLGMSTLTRAVVPILEKRNGSLPSFRAVVPTAVDLNRFRIVNKMPEVVRALFSGTYNDYYDLKLSALFMDELRKTIHVETHWARPLESNKMQIGVGERKIIFVGQSKMADIIPNYSFGVSICKMDAGPSLTAAMPTKIGEFLACGRPVVVNRGLGDMDEFMAESKVGVVVSGDPDRLREETSLLIDLLLDPETPSRCRYVAEKYFSIDFGAETYVNLYTQMLKH